MILSAFGVPYSKSFEESSGIYPSSVLCLFGLYVYFQPSSDSVLTTDFPFLESKRIDE